MLAVRGGTRLGVHRRVDVARRGHLRRWVLLPWRLGGPRGHRVLLHRRHDDSRRLQHRVARVRHGELRGGVLLSRGLCAAALPRGYRG